MKKLIFIAGIAASTSMACAGTGVSHADNLHSMSDNVFTSPIQECAAWQHSNGRGGCQAGNLPPWTNPAGPNNDGKNRPGSAGLPPVTGNTNNPKHCTQVNSGNLPEWHCY